MSENKNTRDDVKAKADEIVANLKKAVKEGNVTRIRIRREDRVILNIPVTAGAVGLAVGVVAAPWLLIVGTITTIGLTCTVEVEKKDGSIVIIHGKE